MSLRLLAVSYTHLFEKECAAEITDKAGQREIFGFARVKENAGYVIYECYQPDDCLLYTSRCV